MHCKILLINTSKNLGNMCGNGVYKYEARKQGTQLQIGLSFLLWVHLLVTLDAG